MENSMTQKTQQIPKAIISKSSYTTGSRCRYATYLNVVKRYLAKPIENELVLISGNEFGEVAAKFMKATYTVEYSEDRGKMVEDTAKAIEAGHKIIANASFFFEGMFCSVDVFIINEDKTITFYEVKSASEMKEIDKFDASFQYVILVGLGYNVKQVFIMHANGEYSFEKGCSINYNDLFVAEEITSECSELEPIVKDDVKCVLESISSGDIPEHEFSSSCNMPYKCPFMEHCIEKAGLPADSNIFKITGPQFTATKLNKWYFNGIKTYQDIVNCVEVAKKKNGDFKDANWKYVQQAQAYLDKEDAPIQMEKLGKFLEGIEYPIASFDYEGFATAVPHYFGLKPSQQIVFQFSYDYIESEGTERQHFECLADPEGDPRFAICKALAKLPKAKSVLVWNKTYEKSRNTEMAGLKEFEKYKEVLLEMVENFVDLMVPFRERIIVPWQANGSYSLKPITEAFIPELRYHDLKVHNGTEAAEKFLEMSNMTKSEKIDCKQALKMYNNQDTYGPLKILEKMIKIYRGDNNFVLFTDKSQKDVVGNVLHVGDTVTCNRGIGVITKITEKYINVMLMNSGKEVRRLGKNIVLIQKYVTDKPRNFSTFGKLERNDLVTCNVGVGKVYGFTKHFVRIKLLNGTEVLRMAHNINKIQSFVE